MSHVTSDTFAKIFQRLEMCLQQKKSRAPSNVYFSATATPYPSLNTLKNKGQISDKISETILERYEICVQYTFWLLCETEEIAIKNLKNMY